MKRLSTLLLFSVFLFPLFAQIKNMMNVVETLYYNRGVYISSDEERAKLNDLIEQSGQHPKNPHHQQLRQVGRQGGQRPLFVCQSDVYSQLDAQLPCAT